MKKGSFLLLTTALLLVAVLVSFSLLERKGTAQEGDSSIAREKNLLVAGAEAGYVEPAACQPCHSQIYETYQDVGMARAFSRPSPEKMIEDWSQDNVYHHEKSDRYYTMYEREGKYYQRRHQIGYDGAETNIVEKEIHFILGSGNHARTYLHMTPDRKLIQLPLGWYSEKGGFWAMNPGYDRQDHLGFRRHIDHGCMFCHNGYPEIEPGADQFGKEAVFDGEIPEGIDCQRCHGPGRDHIEEVQSPGATVESIRNAIVNPGRLDRKKQLETCMQCHLETTSARLPPYLHRYDRNIFSFRPGEPLEDYIIHFDHASGTGHDDKFEIVNAPYRLRMSPCFQKSNLTCLTCHDPHHIPRGEEAERHYVAVCKSCHEEDLNRLMASNQHTNSEDCLQCHMPKRRTDDVVNVVMTDHYIQRFQPERDLLAPLREEDFYGHQYHGEVVLYYPTDLPETGENELYIAVAQVKDDANLKEGIPRLKRAIQAFQPDQPAFYYRLAEAYVEDGQLEEAVSWYEKALEKDPNLWLSQHGLGKALLQLGEYSRSVEALEKALELGADDPTTLTDLALVYKELGRTDEALSALRKAIRMDPDRPEAYNNLGGMLMDRGNLSEAERAFRNAVRLQPDFAGAHANLAKVLAGQQDLQQAQYHFEKALRHNPNHVQARYDYGLTLTQMGLYREAQQQLETALRLEPGRINVHLDLGLVLAVQGKIPAALGHLRQAAESPDPEVRREALAVIEEITGR